MSIAPSFLAFATVGAAAIPNCSFGISRFFSHLDASIVHAFGGGVDIWNISGFFAYDANSKDIRIDKYAQVRELSSGPSFQVFSDSFFANDSSAHQISAGQCSEASVAAAWSFPATSCAGSIERYLPPKALDTWTRKKDAFLGYEVLNGRNVSKWGWTTTLPNTSIVTEQHLVFVDARTGMPVLEKQSKDLESYPTSAEVRFGSFETIYGSEVVFDRTAIFKLPLACAWSLPDWNVTSGSSPYDPDAYFCPKGGVLVQAITHLDKDYNAFYTWPSLPATPPAASVVKVPHEGGPGPEIVCYNDAL